MHTVNIFTHDSPSFYEECFAMMSNLPELGQLVINQENLIVHANKWISDITGNIHENIIGKNISHLFQQEAGETLFDVLRTAGSQKINDIGITTSGGNIKRVELRCVVQNKMQDRPKALITLQDITWKKDVECMARVANERLLTIEEMIGCGILVYNKKNEIEFANQIAAKIVGLPLPNMMRLKMEKLFSDQDWEIFRKFSKISSKNKTRNITLSIKRPDGSTIPVQISLGSFLGSYDENKTYAVFKDLTSKINMENELKQTNRFLENVIQNSVDGIIAADMKGNITIFNEGAENLLGYKSEEVRNKIHISDLYLPSVAKEVMQMLRQSEHGSSGKLPVTPTVLIAKNGDEVPVNISAAIIYEKEREIATVGIFTDLRDRKKMQQQLIQSEKLSSLGTLAAGVAHEINNPLNNISTSCQILMGDLADTIGEGDLQRLQWIESHVDKAADIVRTLLEFSSEHDFMLSPVSLNKTIEDTIKLIQGDIPFNVEVRKEVIEDTLINIDKTRIEQALINLFINAIHAMEQGGSITVQTKINMGKGCVTIVMKDTGAGIPKENLSRIFDPFFTTKPTGVGTGLGLSLTYGIIERHGGTIAVSSDVGKGTCFTISLPYDS